MTEPQQQQAEPGPGGPAGTAEAAGLGHSLGHWVALGAGSVGVAGLLFLRWKTSPEPAGLGTHEQLGLEPCGWLLDWGLPCPGCGVTTSLSLFAHGRLVESAQIQPFGFALAAALVGFFLGALCWQFSGRDLGRDLAGVRLAPWGLGAALLMTLAWIYQLLRLS